MAASLDHVAEGRFTLGLGAGWLQTEHDGYALPFGTTRDRIERLDEALAVIRLLHTERRASFAGRYYRLDDALCEPKPYHGRRLPVLIGGGGERLTLRVVAKHADEWNGEVGPSALPGSSEVLREHCRAVGRNPDDIGVSVVLRSEAQAEAMWEGMVRLNNPNLLAERRRLEGEGVSAADLEAQLRAWVWESLLPWTRAAPMDRLQSTSPSASRTSSSRPRPPPISPGLERFLTRVAARAPRVPPSRAPPITPPRPPPSRRRPNAGPRRGRPSSACPLATSARVPQSEERLVERRRRRDRRSRSP